MRYGRKGKTLVNHLVFVGPAFVFFSLIVAIPFVMGMIYSFTSWNGVSGEVQWVGFENFKKIFASDKQFFASFWFTIRFTVAAVLLSNVIGFILALLLTGPIKTRNMLRTAFFLPNVIGGLILGFVWQFIFVKGFPSIGEATGIGFFKLPWLGDASTAFWGLVIVFVWQIGGYLMVIYVAALQNIDDSLLEAARIDGANRMQILFRMILPLVVPAFTVCLFLTLSWAFKVFDLNLALTNGGPYGSTESVAINIYQEAFQYNRYGLGTAKAFLFFLIIALVTTAQVYFTKKREVEY